MVRVRAPQRDLVSRFPGEFQASSGEVGPGRRQCPWREVGVDVEKGSSDHLSPSWTGPVFGDPYLDNRCRLDGDPGREVSTQCPLGASGPLLAREWGYFLVERTLTSSALDWTGVFNAKIDGIHLLYQRAWKSCGVWRWQEQVQRVSSVSV